MTWIELLFFVGIIIPLVLGLYIDSFSDTGILGTVLCLALYIMIIGAFPASIIQANTPYVITSEVPINILSKTMVDGKLIVITDSADKIEFTSYKDITRLNNNNNDSLVKRYYFKSVVYGFDQAKEQVEIK